MAESNPIIKMEAKGLNFYYGSFQALKDINIAIKDKPDHCIDRSFWMWEINLSPNPQPSE